MEIRLSFGQIECRRCGAHRLLGAPCHACGSPPDQREADVKRQRRRRLAERARSRLDLELPPVQGLVGPAPVFGRLVEWIAILDGAASGLERGQERDAGQELDRAVDELLMLRATVAAAARRRPWVETWRAAERAVAAAAEVLDVYLELLVAATPLQAQKTAPRLQAALDLGATVGHELSEKLGRFDGLPAASAAGDDFASLAAAAFAATGAADLSDFDRRGAVLAERITGGAVLPKGAGVQLAMKQIIVAAVLDEDRYWRVATEVFSALTADPAKLRAACASAEWLEDNIAAGVEARDASFAAQTLAQAAWNKRLEARAIIELGHALVEGPGQHYIATLLAVTGKSAYSRLRGVDAGDLVKRCRSAGFGSWIEGLDDGIRNAKAHSDWSLTDSGAIKLRPGKPGSQLLAPDELLDVVLAGAESLLAIDGGTMLAAASVGVDFSAVDWRKALSLNMQSSVRLMLAMAGWSDIEVHADGDEVVVSGAASALSIGLLGTITVALDADVKRLSLAAAFPNGDRQVLDGPVELLRAARDGSEMAMAELLHGFRLDGRPIVDGGYVRRWATSVAIRALQSPLKDAIADLRSLREFARRIGDGELADLATGTMTLARLITTGDAGDVPNSAPFIRIGEWAKMPVAPPRLG